MLFEKANQTTAKKPKESAAQEAANNKQTPQKPSNRYQNKQQAGEPQEQKSAENVKKENFLLKTIKNKFSRSKQLEGEKKMPTWRKIFDICVGLAVRVVYILEGIFAIYYLVGITGSYYFLFFIILLFIIILDGIYVSCFRHGKEHTW